MLALRSTRSVDEQDGTDRDGVVSGGLRTPVTRESSSGVEALARHLVAV
jgi:hypothetical protein